MPYHHGDLPRALLQHAAEIMEHEGAASLSLREVARRAGVSHAAPARHFADKTALLTALAIEGMREYHAALLEALAATGDDALARARTIARTYVRYAIEHPHALRLASQRELFDCQDPGFLAAEQEIFDLLLGIVSAAQAEGWAREMDPTALLTAVWSTMHGFATLWLEGRLERALGPLDLDATIEQILAYAVSG